MVDGFVKAKKEVAKRQAITNLPPIDDCLVKDDRHIVKKIRYEYLRPNGMKFIAEDFDMQTKRQLRTEHFQGDFLIRAHNFDPKTGKEISIECYAKDGSLEMIIHLMKNGDARTVEKYENGKRTKTYGRAEARRAKLIPI